MRFSIFRWFSFCSVKEFHNFVGFGPVGSRFSNFYWSWSGLERDFQNWWSRTGPIQEFRNLIGPNPVQVFGFLLEVVRIEVSDSQFLCPGFLKIAGSDPVLGPISLGPWILD